MDGPVEHIGVTRFLSPPLLESQSGLRQLSEGKRREHRLKRGPLELETWLSLVKIILETFGRQWQEPCKLAPVKRYLRLSLVTYCFLF